MFTKKDFLANFTNFAYLIQNCYGGGVTFVSISQKVYTVENLLWSHMKADKFSFPMSIHNPYLCTYLTSWDKVLNRFYSKSKMAADFRLKTQLKMT